MALLVTVEGWSWFAVCPAALIGRMTSRMLLSKSWRAFLIEDYVMCVTYAFYVAFIVTSIVSGEMWERHPEVDLDWESVPESSYPALNRAWALTFANEIFQLTCVWLIKACLIILYFRIMKQRWQSRMMVSVAVYVALTYIVMMVCFLAVWCQPISWYWDLVALLSADENSQCNTYLRHSYMNLAFNLSSDLILLAIITPVIVGIQLPWRRKMLLYALLGLGLFNIGSMIACRVRLIVAPTGADWPLWSLREPSTGMLCANLPFVWPLIQRTGQISSMRVKSFMVSLKQATRVDASAGTSRRAGDVEFGDVQGSASPFDSGARFSGKRPLVSTFNTVSSYTMLESSADATKPANDGETERGSDDLRLPRK